ncbi:MAG: hypothetical protein GY763_13610, partial [Gammaproteobacteria bacterium]|nr:hypothetical protein [Gammaproteobacteria bacterium]
DDVSSEPQPIGTPDMVNPTDESDSNQPDLTPEDPATEESVAAPQPDTEATEEADSVPTEEATDEALKDFVDRRKASMDDAWY